MPFCFDVHTGKNAEILSVLSWFWPMCICNPNPYQDRELYNHPKKCLYASWCQNSQPTIQRQILFFLGVGSCRLTLPLSEYHINEILQNILVCVSVVSMRMFLRFCIYIIYNVYIILLGLSVIHSFLLLSSVLLYE